MKCRVCGVDLFIAIELELVPGELTCANCAGWFLSVYAAKKPPKNNLLPFKQPRPKLQLIRGGDVA